MTRFGCNFDGERDGDDDQEESDGSGSVVEPSSSSEDRQVVVVGVGVVVSGVGNFSCIILRYEDDVYNQCGNEEKG